MPRVFDPTAECVFTNEKKKKKAVRNQGSMLKFVLISEPKNGVPKKKRRKELLEGNSSKKIEIFRSMKPHEIETKVLSNFSTISAFTYLQVIRGSQLIIATQQSFDGNELIAESQKRSGNIVYITASKVSNRVCNHHILHRSILAILLLHESHISVKSHIANYACIFIL